MDRRQFVRASVGAGAATLVAARSAAQGAAQTAAVLPASISAPAPYLEEATFADLEAMMASGRASSVDLVERYLARVEALDKSAAGPAMRSVIEVNPEAESIARKRDDERRKSRSGQPRGPLHGVPVMVKDNLDTGDAMATSAGSLALASHHARRDAAVVERLRKAGAVLLGKTNLSEWANFRSTRSSSGWSGRGGQTRNPYVLDRNPCGSSSGSGAAVAASLCGAAIGTETDGSIVCPAGHCGLVGVKPTVGLVSAAGIVPIAHSQDTAGPMARTVRDAAILLGVIADKPFDYAAGLDPKALAGARLGVARSTFGFHEGVDRLMEEALAALKAAGAELVDPVEVAKKGEEGFDDAEYEVLLYEFKADIAAYLKTVDPALRLRTLADLIAWNEAHRDREMPYFGQEIFVKAEEKGPLTDQAYLDAVTRCRRLSRAEGIDAAVGAHRLDAIVAPTNGPAWVTDLLNGDHYVGGTSSPAAVAGYPNITVPAGQVRGLPVGISFFGPAWSEARLLAIAYAFEQATKHRQAPRYFPTLQV